MSELVIKKKDPKVSAGWKPVCISADLHEQLKSLAADANMSTNELASKMMTFAMEHLVIVEDDKNADKKGV